MNARYGAAGSMPARRDHVVEERAEAGEGGVAALQVFACLPARVAADVGWQTLGGVREQELVRLFDDVDPRVELGEAFRRAHAWPAGLAAPDVSGSATRQRLGS